MDLQVKDESCVVVEDIGGVGEDVVEGNLAKKQRRCSGGGGGGGGDGEGVRRVAEIVMVLSAMAEMRGGRKPTEIEVKLMAEAREKVVKICEELEPRDIVAVDAIGTVIEDLGLNGKIEDQKLGFRGTKMSIAEKLALSKRKMEESKKFAAPAQSTSYAPHPPQTNFSQLAENRGTSPSVRMLPSDKASPAQVSSGGFAAMPHGHGTTTPMPASQPFHFHTGEARASAVSSGQPSSHSMIKVDRPHGSNGPAYTYQMHANSTANQPMVNAQPWLHISSSASNKVAVQNRDLNHKGTSDSSMARMAPHEVSNPVFTPFVTQTAGNFQTLPPMQAANVAQAHLNNKHIEIAKIVQNVLQPQPPEYPTWTPPSREYMNKALTCQMCKQTINDVDSVLLCDACERGFHLKCQAANNLKPVPRAEWHCTKCLMLSNGKPLPPKYGRVMRSMSSPNVPSNLSGPQPSTEKKVESLDSEVSQQGISLNESSSVQNPDDSGTAGANSDLGSDSKAQVVSENSDPKNIISSTLKDDDQRTSPETLPDDCTKTDEILESSEGKENSVSDTEFLPAAIISDTIDTNTESSNNTEVVDQMGVSNNEEPLKTDLESKPSVGNSDDIRVSGECASSPHTVQKEEEIVQKNVAETSVPAKISGKSPMPSSDALNNVEWVGNVLQVLDGKTYHESCYIDGVNYKIQDNALFRSGNDELIPSKVQAMWEDSKTGSKWVTVNRCYFPGDLPESVARPCPPEINEVYASHHDSSIMAGCIEGACEVLPAEKFEEESKRRSLLGENHDSPPVFLCKWFYDEFKGNFHPVSS